MTTLGAQETFIKVKVNGRENDEALIGHTLLHKSAEEKMTSSMKNKEKPSSYKPIRGKRKRRVWELM